MSATHFPIESSLGRDLVAVRHSKVRHPVQRRTSDQHLRRLPFKATRTHTFTKDRLHTKDLRLSQRAPMIARFTFPLTAPLLSDRSQVLISNVSFSLRIPVLPNLRPLLRRNRCPRLALSDGVIAV